MIKDVVIMKMDGTVEKTQMDLPEPELSNPGKTIGDYIYEELANAIRSGVNSTL